jgi:hypothetical protein
MAWKQDLEKLKQQLGPEALTPAPRALPKPVVKPTGPIQMEDEDAVFLSAMGLKPAAAHSAEPAIPKDAGRETGKEEVATPSPAPETFQEAVRDLKGFKPMARRLPDRPAPLPTPVVAMVPTAPPPVLPVAPVQPEAPPEPEAMMSPSLKPQRFQLAAGMAIEVDASLDLRGHSLSDAMERLKDRLGDGKVLNWRSLQVTLGPDSALHEGLLDLLDSGQAPMVARYAQAPIPMGGTQAWLLYLGSPPANPDAR